ncbi:shTK domain protein [Ancylostoma caninum]|uniref:ShTK domain protein n=1 Tax=Ancylostoma caninum TaxID=29170 RepID=A0A368G5G1_ANCCA|nr:shTK domain protein [Ancylostoma caninum]
MDDERPDNCFKYPGLRELAITACSKRCGYCCINPAYNCRDKPNPRISCQVITPDMCVSPYWKNIIAEDCPTACGFCQTPIGDCADRAAGCGNDLSICINIYMQDFVKQSEKRQEILLEHQPQSLPLFRKTAKEHVDSAPKAEEAEDLLLIAEMTQNVRTGFKTDSALAPSTLRNRRKNTVANSVNSAEMAESFTCR